MHIKTKSTLFILFLSGIMFGKNLEILSRSRINNFELLDVYIHQYQNIPIAIVPGGLGGTNFIDVSNPAELVVLSEYFASGCDWGRIYSWSAKDHVAYGSGRECGIHIVDLDDFTRPSRLSTITGTASLGNAIRYEHTSVYENLLLASRHQAGVEIFSIDDPTNPQQISEIFTDNAWATLAENELLYIADGSFGIKIYDISDPSIPVKLSEIETNGSAKDIDKVGDFIFVAVGAGGVDMIDVSDQDNPFLISNYNTTGYASRVSANDSLVAVSDWDDVEVLRFSNRQLELAGYKNTGGRVMALAMSENFIYSAEWRQLAVFEYGPISEPDIDLNTRKIEFPRTNNGSSYFQSIQIENNGLSPLEISAINISSSDFTLNYDNLTLPPQTSQILDVVYTPSGSIWSGNIDFLSNDNDEIQTRLRTLGNFPFGPMPGDPAPNFSLPIVNGTGNLSLTDLGGQPALIAFFTGW